MVSLKRNKSRRWSTTLEPEDHDVLNVAAAARMLGVSPRLVLRLARQKNLPGKKVGKEWRFRRAALLQWLGKVETTPDWVRALVESGKAEVIEKKKR